MSSRSSAAQERMQPLLGGCRDDPVKRPARRCRARRVDTPLASKALAMADERGHLKVFIGMAPGVGKTYRMLQEGSAEADNGRDVVIGYLEPHGRTETV